MKRKNAQSFLITGGVLALLGSGSCFLSFNPPVNGDWVILAALSGVFGLLIGVILALIGLIGLAESTGND